MSGVEPGSASEKHNESALLTWDVRRIVYRPYDDPITRRGSLAMDVRCVARLRRPFSPPAVSSSP